MKYSKTGSMFLKISSVLWVIWGVVHIIAGLMTMKDNTGDAISAIADGVDPALITSVDYPDAAGGVINQHGWNLFWGGLVPTIGAIYIWRGSPNAIFVSALVGGLLDVGYFVFIDLAGYNKFFPGTIMTIISAGAIILSFYAYFKTRDP